MKIQDINTIETEDQARSIAIDWQSWQADQALSIGELLEWCNYFEALADAFGLVEEFQENGII